MTQDEIIRMAREAGLGFFRIRDSDNTSVDALERFAALVAAHQREACAKVCEPVEGSAYEVGVYKTMQTLAAAIRARGEK